MIYDWHVEREEQDLIDKICTRAQKLCQKMNVPFDYVDLSMDITACHLHGCKLKLEEFLKADDFNFSHDIGGIRRHIDRGTGKLKNCFLPRFAA